MITVTRGNEKMTLRDNNQLSAFLNNGWTQEQEKPVKTKEAVKAEDKATETPAPKTTRRRRTTTKAD